MPDRNEILLLELLAPLGGDAPGDRIAVAATVGRALVEAGVARPAGDEAAARRHLRQRQRPPAPAEALVLTAAQPSGQNATASRLHGPRRSP